jgi:predicted outer membrane repeat protein
MVYTILKRKRVEIMRLNKIVAGVSSFMLVLSPMCVYAEDTIYATDVNGNNYTSISDAWSAACSGTEITMAQDWILESSLCTDENQTITINMNGHKIDRNQNDETKKNGEVIYLDENSNLTLNGSNDDITFDFHGYSSSGNYKSYSLKSGGLITGGACEFSGGGIHMLENSSLILNHVAVAGNKHSFTQNGAWVGTGGGIYMKDDNCTVILKNALVEHNFARTFGGGIYSDGKNAKIILDASEISYNSSEEGGGIYSDASGMSIVLSNSSGINNNNASYSGGGVYFEDTNFSIKSADEDTNKLKNKIYNNTAKTYGAGIFSEIETIGSNYGEISGLSIEHNTVGTDDTSGEGGGIHMGLENVKVSNCYFADNFSTGIGGAIYIFNDGATIENCEIRNNQAEKEGGGIYCDSTHDITLSGRVIIKGNKRSGDVSDDLFLESTWYSTAYVKGEVSSGSEVGIRTADDGEIQIGKNISSDCSNYFFLNDSGDYRVSYEEGKLYKRESLTGSIFGNSNTIIAACVMGGIVVIGGVVLVVNKKKN